MLKKFFIFLFIALCGVGVFGQSSTPTEAGIHNFIVAAKKGNKKSVQSFLKKYPTYIDVVDGIYLNPNNYTVCTALMAASFNGHTEVVSLLLKAGADVNAKNNDGETALMLASAFGHTEIVSLLLKAEADVNAKDKQGWTALMDASCSGHTEVVSLLLKAGADVNAKPNYGETALMLASDFGHTEVVSLLLLKAGADVNAKDNYGETALMQASFFGYTEIVSLLLGAGADVNAKGDCGETALMQASEYGHTEVVSLLLKAGADINAKANNGFTALKYASRKGYTEIVSLLGKQVNKTYDEFEQTEYQHLGYFELEESPIEIYIGKKDNRKFLKLKFSAKNLIYSNAILVNSTGDRITWEFDYIKEVYNDWSTDITTADVILEGEKLRAMRELLKGSNLRLRLYLNREKVDFDISEDCQYMLNEVLKIYDEM